MWLDGNDPQQLRSKFKFVTKDVIDISDVPKWNFDGSSTNQAPGDKSECQLIPARLYTFDSSYHIVLCEVYDAESAQPHKSNKRCALRNLVSRSGTLDMWLGFEQEYFITKDGIPLGFKKSNLTRTLLSEGHTDVAKVDLVGPGRQGPFYCSVGGSRAFGRNLVEKHVSICEILDVTLTGTNAEVAPGQWEYQCFAKDPIAAADNLWMSRYLLLRSSEEFGYDIDFSPKPAGKDYNGSGCHANFSSNFMREVGGREYFDNVMSVLRERKDIHIKEYGKDNKQRLTGDHETQSIDTFSWGVADRGASIRIPNDTVANNWKGYAEDRRPAANCDPYNITRLLLDALITVEK